MVHISWEAEETITKFWLECDILPSGHVETLISDYGKATTTRELRKGSDFYMLVTMFKDLKVHLPGNDPLIEESGHVTEMDILVGLI